MSFNLATMLRESAAAHPDKACCRAEEVEAVLALRPGTTATAEEIVAFCRARLAAYKCPRSVRFLPELPKNATGKLLKRALREG